MKEIVIAHLYPDEMNIYGDSGNVMVLTKRLTWRGFKVRVDQVKPQANYDLRTADIVFGGGGQDRGQVLIADDLQSRANNFHQAVADGVVVLAICGTYQLLGHGFKTADDQQIPGIGVFKANTVASSKRMIGNVVIDTAMGVLVGFENHSGQTTLESNQMPLGRIVKGYGNNSEAKTEGAISGNAFGTYMHGPLLPKNPVFADALIRLALERKDGQANLEHLDDSLEFATAKIAKYRPR